MISGMRGKKHITASGESYESSKDRFHFPSLFGAGHNVMMLWSHIHWFLNNPKKKKNKLKIKKQCLCLYFNK